MDKSKYEKKITFKLFGKVLIERIEHYGGVDVENVEPLTPIILVENENDYRGSN